MSDDSLRQAERDATTQPGAATLSRFAFELARASRSEDAVRVALRAVAFDPSVEARELLPPTWIGEKTPRLYNAVSWSGLRQLGRVRSLEGVPGGAIKSHYPASPFVDLGQGRVSYRSGDELLGVDVLVGKVLWRQRALDPIGLLDGKLVALGKNADGTAFVATLELATGAEESAPFELGVPPGQTRFRLEDHVLVIHDVLDSHTDVRRTKRSALVSFDLRSRTRLDRVDLPPMHEPMCERAGPGILVCDWGLAFPRPGCRAVDIQGRELWHFPNAVRPEAVVDGRAVFAAEDGAAIFDTATATTTFRDRHLTQGVLDCLAESVFVSTHQSTLLAFDRATLDPLWDGLFESDRVGWAHPGTIMATRDSLLVFQASSNEELVSIEPRTGIELSRVSLGPTPPRASGTFSLLFGALVAERAVIGSSREGERPLLVVEDGAVDGK